MGRRRNRLPNAREIRQLLSRATFNPNEEGPLAVVTESGDIHYFELRAIELIREAQFVRTSQPFDDSIAAIYEEKLLRATQLLTLARAKNAEAIRTYAEEGAGSQDTGGIDILSPSP
jgi:hypothetical protein